MSEAAMVTTADRDQVRPTITEDIVAACRALARWSLFAVLLLVPLIWSPAANDLYNAPKLVAMNWLTIIAVGSFLVGSFLTGRIRFALTKPGVAVLAVLAIMTLATVRSISPLNSLFGEYSRDDGLVTLVNYALLFFLGANLLRRPRDREIGLACVGIALLITSVLAILEAFGLRLTAIGAAALMPHDRPFGAFGNPDFLGSYLSLSIPVSAALFLFARSRNWKLLWAATLVLGAAALMFNFTRGAWIGAFAGMLVLLISYKEIARQWRWVVPSLAVMALACVVALFMPMDVRGVTPGAPTDQSQLAQSAAAPASTGDTMSAATAISGTQALTPQFGGRLNLQAEVQSGSLANRLVTWKAGLDIIRDNPLLGTGPNTYQAAMGPYTPANYAMNEGKDNMPDRPHNGTIQWGTSAGVGAILAYLALLGLVIWVVVRAICTPGLDGRQRLLLVGGFAGWVAYVVQDQFLFGTVGTASQWWLLTGLLVGASLVRGKRKARLLPFSSLPVAAILSIVVAAGTLYVGFLAVKPAVADRYLQLAYQEMHSSDQFIAARGLRRFDAAISWAPNPQHYYEEKVTAFTGIAPTQPDAHARKHYLDEAEQAATQAVLLDPYNAGEYFGRAVAYLGYGDDRKLDAFHDLQKTVELRPYDFYANTMLAQLAEEAGDATDAMIARRHLVYMDPSNPQAIVQLGQDYLQLRRFLEVDDLIRRLAALNPNGPELHFLTGMLHEAKGELDQAIAEYQATLAVAPDNHLAAMRMQYIEQQQEQQKQQDAQQPQDPHAQLDQQGQDQPTPTP